MAWLDPKVIYPWLSIQHLTQGMQGNKPAAVHLQLRLVRDLARLVPGDQHAVQSVYFE